MPRGTKSAALARKLKEETPEGLCVYCKERPGTTIDHVHPQSRGGKNTESNFVPACGSCNSRKGDMTGGEYLEFLRTGKLATTYVNYKHRADPYWRISIPGGITPKLKINECKKCPKGSSWIVDGQELCSFHAHQAYEESGGTAKLSPMGPIKDLVLDNLNGIGKR